MTAQVADLVDPEMAQLRQLEANIASWQRDIPHKSKQPPRPLLDDHAEKKANAREARGSSDMDRDMKELL